MGEADVVKGDANGSGVYPAADPCPACGVTGFQTLLTAEDRRFRTTAARFPVVECSECRLIRIEPQPTPERLRQYYPPCHPLAVRPPALSVKALWERFLLTSHLHFVERALYESGETGVVLDVGCGQGNFLYHLRDRGVELAAGVEFSLAAAADAWKVHEVPAVCATLTRAPFAPGSCAAVTMFMVLQHLYSPADYLDAAHKLLAPEGRLIVQVPNASSWQFLIFGSQWIGLDIPRQLILFKAADIEKLLEECGFEILRRKHFCLRDNPAMLVASLFPGLDPEIRKARQVQESSHARFWKNLAYNALFTLAIPVAFFESACHAGATVMIEARTRK
ncbi:MAG: class I SAM-dependent methyltransferase [Bryobacteraceae bacterium]